MKNSPPLVAIRGPSGYADILAHPDDDPPLDVPVRWPTEEAGNGENSIVLYEEFPTLNCSAWRSDPLIGPLKGAIEEGAIPPLIIATTVTSWRRLGVRPYRVVIDALTGPCKDPKTWGDDRPASWTPKGAGVRTRRQAPVGTCW